MTTKFFRSFILLFLISACEEKTPLITPQFDNNPDALETYNELTQFGTTLPTADELVRAVSEPGRLEEPCPSLVAHVSTRNPTSAVRQGSYQIRSQDERRALVDQIIAAGAERLGKTRLVINGATYEVMNDHVTLPDGTYVPLTFPESQRIAQAWGYQIPSADQLVAIARHASSQRSQFSAITRAPNNDQASQLASMNAMMNDPRMHERARAGQDRLIDGHFKWYTNDGRIYGFARGDGSFYHNRPSGAHVSQSQYYDYSHGLRLIRRVSE